MRVVEPPTTRALIAPPATEPIVSAKTVADTCVAKASAIRHASGVSLTRYDPRRILAFGGSFSPPTIAHMAAPVRLMMRYGFQDAVIIPAVPYKEGAAPADVSLGLTKLAVQNLDEILDLYGVEYRDFVGREDGSATWLGSDGRRYNVRVSDFEIRKNMVRDTPNTIGQLPAELSRQTGRDVRARDLHWVSGEDSFASIPTWSKDNRWTNMLRQANWIVIKRGNEHDTVAKVLAADTERLYSIHDSPSEACITFKPNNGETCVYFADIPSLDISSTLARIRLAKIDKRSEVPQLVQPSVLKACLSSGFYGDEHTSRIFDRANLEFYLRHALSRAAAGHADPQVIADVTDRLVRTLSEAAEAYSKVPHGRATFAHACDEFLKWVNPKQVIQTLRRELPKLASGDLTAQLSLGAINTFIEPLLNFWNVQAFGPAYGLSTPSTDGRRRIKRAFQQWKLGDPRRVVGDRKFAERLTGLRQRLLRGDPSAIIGTQELQSIFALDDSAIALNIVKSRLPAWMPLAVRRANNSKVMWHDLNVSTNELSSCLARSDLERQISLSAKTDKNLYQQCMLAAVLRDENAKRRFDLLVGHRYFKRMCNGVPSELQAGFRARERDFLQDVEKVFPAVAGELNGDERETFVDVISDFFVLSCYAQNDPSALRRETFWQDFLAMMVHRYPGRPLDLDDKAQRHIVASRLPILAELITTLDPQLAKLSVTLNGAVVAEMQPSGFHALDSRLTEPSRRRDYMLVRSAAKSFVERCRDHFTLQTASTTTPASDSTTNNFVWEIEMWRAELRSDFANLEGSFDHAKRFLDVASHHPDALDLCRAQLDFLDSRLVTLEHSALQFEYEWLQEKISLAKDSSETEPRLPFEKRWRTIRDSGAAIVEQARKLCYTLNGIRHIDLNDINALRTQLTADRMALDDVRPRYAVVDLGTWGAKLLVTDADGRVIAVRSRTTGLGEGVKPGASIPAANEERAAAVVKALSDEADRYGVSAADIEIIATAVVRNSDNGTEVLQRLGVAAGTDRTRVLSGADEARLAYTGVAAEFSENAPSAVIDIGGSSFQVARGAGTTMNGVVSRQVGVYRAMELCAGHASAEVAEELKREAPVPELSREERENLRAVGWDARYFAARLGNEVLGRERLAELRDAFLRCRTPAARAKLLLAGLSERQREALSLTTLEEVAAYAKAVDAALSLFIHVLDGTGASSVTVSQRDTRHAVMTERLNEARLVH